MDSPSTAPLLVATLLIESDRYDPDHGDWLQQQQDLFRTLTRSLDADQAHIERVSVPVPGTRGTLDSVLLQILTPAGLGAAVALCKAWLEHHGHAKLHLDVEFPDGRKGKVSVDASGALAGDVGEIGGLIAQLKT